MAKQKVKLEVTVEYDDENTDEEWVVYEMDKLVQAATSTSDALGDSGPVKIGEFSTAMFIHPDVKF